MLLEQLIHSDFHILIHTYTHAVFLSNTTPTEVQELNEPQQAVNVCVALESAQVTTVTVTVQTVTIGSATGKYN